MLNLLGLQSKTDAFDLMVIVMIYAQYFSQKEFRDWAKDMSPRLITMLDVLRFRLGSAIAISASEYAFGLNIGLEKLSEHNINHWGKIGATLSPSLSDSAHSL